MRRHQQRRVDNVQVGQLLPPRRRARKYRYSKANPNTYDKQHPKFLPKSFPLGVVVRFGSVFTEATTLSVSP